MSSKKTPVLVTSRNQTEERIKVVKKFLIKAIVEIRASETHIGICIALMFVVTIFVMCVTYMAMNMENLF